MTVRHPNLPRITPLSAEINRRCCGLNWNTMEGDAFEHEVNPNRRAYGQGGTKKLPRGQAEKDRLPVLVDFLWNFDLHIAITSKMDFLTRFLKYEIIFVGKTIHFKNK